jgi:arabinofuranosyltransferase
VSPSRFSVAACALALLVYAWHVSHWRFLCDDAYISFRYAENLAAHGEAAYNVAPLERIEGYSNPLWVVILAIAAWAGLGVPEAATTLCALAGAVVVVVGVLLMRRLEPQAPWAWALPSAWLIVLPEFVVWGSGGLETMFVVALGLSAWLALEHGRHRTAASLAAATVLTRADAVLWLAPLLALRLWQRWRVDGPTLRPDRRTLAIAIAWGMAPVVAHVCWRVAYYGSWTPQTWAIKRHGVALWSSSGLAYLGAWAANVAVPLGVAALVGVGLTIYGRRVSAAAAAVAVSSLGIVVWAGWVGGDFMAYSRFLLPATVLWAMAIGLAWAGAASDSSPRARSIRVAAIVAGVGGTGIAASLVPERLRDDGAQAWLEGRYETVQAMDAFAAERVAAGRAFARAVPPQTRVVVGAAGAMPWASGLPTWDVYGLVSPGVLEGARIRTGAKARPGHQVTASAAYVRALEADLWCHVGTVQPSPPPRREAVRRGGAGATWECVETGPLPDRIRGDRSSRYYCCVRPAQRSTSPRAGATRSPPPPHSP